MTDRERLIELIREAKKHTKNAKSDLERNMIFADYLLENGVIVPPCKPGDTAYCVRTWPSGRKTIHKFEVPDWDWIIEHLNDFGKTIFLTREEAKSSE